MLYTSGSASVKEVREEYGKWLSSVFGQVPRVGLGTFTFRTPVGVKSRYKCQTAPGSEWDRPGRQYVTRAAQRLVSLLAEGGSTYFICLEEGSDTRRLHLHALESNEERVSRIIHREWARRYGFESYRDVRSKMAVSLYVSKYVTKSDLPFWAGGPLFKSSSHTGAGAPGRE